MSPARQTALDARPTGTFRGTSSRWFLAYSSSSRLPDPPHLAMLARPGVVRAAPALSGTSRIGLPSASPLLLRQARRRRSLTSTQIISASRRTGIQVKPHYVADLRHEQRILGQFPRILLVRRQSKCPPYPRDHRLAQPEVGGHRPRRPLRGIRRRGLQRRGDQRFDLGIADHPRPAWPRLVEQPIAALLNKAVTPPLHRRPRDSHPGSQIGIGLTISGRQHNSRPQDQPCSTGATPSPPL